MVEWIMEGQVQVCGAGGDKAWRQGSHLPAECWGLHQSSEFLPEVVASISCFAGPGIGGGGAQDVSWCLVRV